MARTVHLDPELLADLKLAVTEACANAVRHAYEAEGAMTLSFSVEERLVRIDVEDEGTGFQARQVEQWEPDALSEDGMGLAIIRAVVDELEISSGPGRPRHPAHADEAALRAAANASSRVAWSSSTVSSFVIAKIRRASRRRLDEVQLAATLAQASERSDQHAERARVEKRHGRQVDDEPLGAAPFDQLVELGPQLRRGERVELARRRDDEHGALLLDRNPEERH